MSVTDPAAQAAALRALIDAYRVTTYSNYVAMGGFALVIVDYLHTLPEEVRYMWPAKLSLPKVIFLVLRYYVFVNNVFTSIYVIPRDASPEDCYNRFFRAAMSSTVLVVGAEAILFLRVYAFSGRSKKFLAYLIIQFLVIDGSSYPVLIHFLNSMEYTRLPFRNVSCMPIQANGNILGGVFAILLAGAVVALLLMVFLALRKHRLELTSGVLKNGSLLSVFYRDGLLYFVSLSAILSANIIVTFAAPRQYKLHFIQLAVNIYTILSTRMLLHLRQWAERDGLQEFQSGTFASRTMDGIDYSAIHRPLTPIRFQEGQMDAPTSTRWGGRTWGSSQTDVEMTTAGRTNDTR